jgi:hypothetical protein
VSSLGIRGQIHLVKGAREREGGREGGEVPQDSRVLLVLKGGVDWP